MRLFITAVMILSSVQALAEEGMTSNYSFASACSSQGSWTQNALSATQALRKVTLQLKNDTNCTNLGNTVQAAIANLENQIQSTSDTPARAARLSQIPQEINALRSFAEGSNEMRPSILKLMMGRSIEGAQLSAQVGSSASTDPLKVRTESLMDFGARLKRTTTTGLSLLNQVVDSIPQLDQCLTSGGKTALGSYLGMAVQVVSSFASGGSDTSGSQLAVAVSKIASLVREKKYAKILRKLNQQEFLASMTCLMEVTSQSYCDARDGMQQFKNGMKDLKLEDSKQIDPENNPFTGYYVLNTHVPNVTRWLQKIQIGVDPKLPTDAIFQNQILGEITDYNKGVKSLLGLFNTALSSMKSLPSLEAKQNALVNLIMSISNQMIGNGFQEKTNFFTISKSAIQIPFFLIDAEVPNQVSGKMIGNQPVMQISAEMYFRANAASMPGFNDPISLAENVIERNMKKIINEANVSSIEYFNKWFIVDKPSLVNESLTDINYTVKDSLVAIDKYLRSLQAKVIKMNGELSLIPTIVDTRNRLAKILAGYKRIQDLGQRYSALDVDKLSAEDLEKIPEAYEALINIVYEQFNIMLARSGFLANRMTNFVYQDYIMLIHNKINFTEHQQELFTATGMAALDRMIQNYGGNPANVQADLNMALKINKGNIEALELLLKDNVIANIAQLKLISEGKGTTSARLWWDGYKRARNDNALGNAASGGFMPVGEVVTWWKWLTNSDRYPKKGSKYTAPQSEFNDAGGLYAQLCIQSLAFVDQGSILPLCAGARLKSPLRDDHSVSYIEKYQSHMADAVDANMKKSLNHSERICAYRDYNRKNMVLFMSLGKK